MVYVFGALISIQIVLGQVLWKIGVGKLDFEVSKETIFSSNILTLLFSPYFIFGALSYVMATVMFMIVLGKYEYTHLQAVVVSTSLLFTFIAASVLFGEKIVPLNIIGFAFLIIGVIFVTRF